VRVQLTPTATAPRGKAPRRRNERGAVAVLSAALATILCLMAGFSIDFGMAYNMKRQLQTSADAAALAAASVYAKYPGSCSQLIAKPAYKTEAQAAADDEALANESDRQTNPITLSCASDGSLEVTYSNTGATPSLFGKLAGVGSTITTGRTATAADTVSPGAATGVRPMAMCSASLPPLDKDYNQFVRIDNPSDGHKKIPACPDAGAAGNWWTVDCPEERTGSTGVLTTEILNGCNDGVSVAGSGSTAAALTISLETACPSAPQGSETCLSGDPGQMDSGGIENSWGWLIDHQTPIVLPVFCVAPQCTESTLDGSGTNAVFPVYKLAAVVVCGYHFGKNVKYTKAMSTSDPCYGNTLPDVTSDTSDDNYMQVVFVSHQTSGGTSDTECALGGLCDGGLRRVLLTQ